jgi:ferrous iron transport protein B
MSELRVALAGNPNSGKTTVFNGLTGSRQHVGNWPGVTVEKKEGEFREDGARVLVTDLPGIYSLTPRSIDERIARDFILDEHPDAVVAVIDSSNLERNLYLVTQLLEIGASVVLDLNMMDITERKGITVDVEKISKVLGIKVVQTVANRAAGLDDLKRAIASDGRKQRSTPFRIDYGEDLEPAIDRLSGLIEESGAGLRYPARWLAIQLLEGQVEYLESLRDLSNWKEIEAFLIQTTEDLEHHFGYDLETAIVERRYGFLEGLVRECTQRRLGLSERLDISDRIDAVVTNRYLGIPIFLGFMWIAFQLVFTLGAPLADLIGTGFEWLAGASSQALSAAGLPEWVGSLVGDGIIGGVGSVLVFLPNILILFLVIALLEGSGYMARAAFVMDRLMHALGLHGKSFIPMILGFGCNIPAIMACRTLESRKDRILTIVVNPLMSCSARLPIYTLFAGVFFTKHQGLVVFSLYVLGMVLAVLVARIFKRLFFQHEVAPLIMELPPYRMPQIKSVLIHMWQRASLFLRRAGTVIFAGVVIIWLLASLPAGVEYGSRESLIGALGLAVAPALSPAGFGFWQAGVALIFGFVAKEVVVGTLGTLYAAAEGGLEGAIAANFTPLSAYAFMVMCLIYVPCLAAVAAIRREAGLKWALVTVGYSLVLGWTGATLIYQIGSLLGG